MAVKLIKESKNRKRVSEAPVGPDNYAVKQIMFDVVVPRGTDLKASGGSGNQDFYQKLDKFLNDQFGYFLAGDIIDTYDITSAYEGNIYFD